MQGGLGGGFREASPEWGMTLPFRVDTITADQSLLNESQSCTGFLFLSAGRRLVCRWNLPPA